MIPGVVAGQMRQAAPTATLTALIASLSPAIWMKADDNAASSTVINSGSTGNGQAYSAVDGAGLALKNTSLLSAAALTASSTNSFYLNASSMVEMPSPTLSSETGWTVSGIVRIDSVPSLSGVAAIAQLTNTGSGCPELGAINVDGSTWRFRVMVSGVAEVTMTATPTYSYGAIVRFALRKRAGGVVDLFVNGSLVASSTAAPSYSYSGAESRFGAGRFGGNTTYYSIPGAIDEAALFTSPLSDADCISLTTLT